MVPLLVWFFEAQGLPKAHILHLAVGTAMATILFTSVASVRAHAARGAIRWDIARNVTPGILAGGLVGSWIASFIPPLLFAAALHRGHLRRRDQSPARPQSQAFAPAAGLRGNVRFRFPGERALSVRAIGGAFMTVPFMLWCNVPMLQAIGTAAVIGFPIALSGHDRIRRHRPARNGAPALLGRLRFPARARRIVGGEHADGAARRGCGTPPAHGVAQADFRGALLR